MTSGSELTRDQVAAWLKEYDGKLEPSAELRKYLVQKIDEATDEPMIDTRYRDGLEAETHVVDMILEDLTSYAS